VYVGQRSSVVSERADGGHDIGHGRPDGGPHDARRSAGGAVDREPTNGGGEAEGGGAPEIGKRAGINHGRSDRTFAPTGPYPPAKHRLCERERTLLRILPVHAYALHVAQFRCDAAPPG